MEHSSTKSLIEELAQDLTPVKRLAHPLVRIAPFVVLFLCYVAGMLFVTGFRPDFLSKLGEAGYLFELSLTVSLSVTSAFAAAWLCVPDLRGQNWILALPLTLLGVFILMIGTDAYAHGAGHMPEIIEPLHVCVENAGLFGAVPLALLVWLTRRGNTVYPGLMAGMSGLSVGALGWAALRVSCASDELTHIFIYHFTPYMLAGIVIGMLARRLYRW